MTSILRKILFLIALLMVPGSGICTEETDLSTIKTEFGFNKKVSKQEPSIQKEKYSETVILALIENNKQYVEITASLYALSLIIILILMKLTPHQAKDLVTIIGLISVVFTTMLLVLIVDTTETLTAPMGILGAIAGYLFGTAQKREGSEG